MKRKILLFSAVLLIYLASLTVLDGQPLPSNLPDGVIGRFSHGASIYTVAFSTTGQLLASGGDDNSVILWNVTDGSKREEFVEHNKFVTSVAFSPDGHRLASASLDGFVRLWSLSSERQRTSDKDEGDIESVAFSPNGKVLASGGGDRKGFVTLWDIPQESRIVTFPAHGGIVESVAFSPDGQLLASASRDKTIKLWDVGTQDMRKTLAGHKNVVRSVAFSPNGKMLASSSRDYTIKLWNVVSEKLIDTLEIQGNNYIYAESVTFSPDGTLLAAACVDYTVKLWNVTNLHGTPTTLKGHYGGVTSVAFSPDGRTLASGSRDRTVLLWDLAHFGFEVPPIASAPKESASFADIMPEPPLTADLPKKPESNVSENETTLHPKEITPDTLEEEPKSITPKSANLPRRQDTTPPNIEILSPTERVVPQSVEQLIVRGIVTDSSDISEVKVNKIKVAILEDGTFTTTVLLSNGENDIRVTAIDKHNNLGAHLIPIVREGPNHIDTTPPEIVIHSPLSRSAQLTADRLTIEGSVTDESRIAEVRVNNTQAVVSETGEFVVIVPLDLGDNEIRIIATDMSGHVGTDLLTVHRGDLKGPEINILSPRYEGTRGVKPVIIVPTDFTDVSGTATDPSGVATVMINDTEAQVTGDKFSQTIQLAYGNNLIIVTATDLLGNQSTKEITIFRDHQQNGNNNYARRGKDYALLFAVDTYDHWPGLRYPRIDALNIGQDLEDIYGFEVELIHNPTKEKILSVLHRYAQKEYGPEDQLLIFFAGHGDFEPVGNMGYLVCQDTKKPEDDSFRISSFSHSYFRDFIDRMSCEHIFLVMDTCYSGTFDERLAMRGEADDVIKPLSQADIKRKLGYTTRWYLTSGANEQVPDDSFFARALLDALRSEGGSDSVLTIKEILTYFEGLSAPKPCFGEFGRNAPGSDFLFIKK